MGFLDRFLDNISALHPALAEMRWNQLQHEYEHECEKELGSLKGYSSSDFDYKAFAAAERRNEWKNATFTPALDRKYSDMLKKAKKLAAPKDEIPELPANVSAGNINKFLREVEEELKELLEFDLEFDDDFYEFASDSIECSARDYNESGYDTKSEAKADCRQAIKSAIQDVKDQYESEKSSLIAAVESELACMKLPISSIKDKFRKIFATCADRSLDEATKKYVLKRFDELYKQWNSENSDIDSDMDNEYSTKVSKVTKTYFKPEEADLSKQTALLELCDFSQGWHGDYKFATDDACKTLVEEHSAVLKCAIKELPFVLFRTYENIRFERASRLFKIIYMLK